MKKHLFITLILAIVVALTIAACQPAGTGEGEGESVPAEPEETPVSADSSADMEVLFDPALLPGVETNAYVYETLLKVEEDQIVPALALAYTVSDDGLDYILDLRPGVAFHDETNLNADAVVANFNRWFDPEDSLRGSGSYQAWEDNFGGFKGDVDDDGKPKSNFDGIEKVDELTVLIHLNTPDAEFPNKLADPAFAIVSPEALAAPGFGTSEGVDGGTGPYLFGAFSAGSLTLEPNPDYWDPDAIPASSIEVTP